MTTATAPRRSRTKRARRATGKNVVVSRGLEIDLAWSGDGKEAALDRVRRKAYQLRMFHEMTQAQLAERAGLHFNTVKNFEDVENIPQRAPRLATYLSILSALGCRVRVLLPEGA